MEIERKFLLKEDVQQEIILNNLRSHQLIQYYVQVGEEEERYRKQDNLYFHTLKRRVDGGLQREETETECTKDDFDANKRNIKGNIVEKKRYIFPYGEHKIEIDVYDGTLKGLIIGEVEFQTKNEADSFILPDFFGLEVTWDKRFKNQSLAINGLPENI